jgi:hypothetical protein
MRNAVVVFFFTLVAANNLAQGKQQTRFGPEIDIEQRAGIPSYFSALLTKDDRQMLTRCQHDNELSYLHKKSALDHFVGSFLDVRNPSGITTLLIVQSDSSCFNGAHNSKFWILAKQKNKTSARYKKIFEGQADGLEVAKKANLRYPRLEVFSHTAVEGYTSTLKYSRGTYRTVSCYVEALEDDKSTRRKIACEKYNWEFRK